MRRLLALVLVASLGLTGCGLIGGGSSNNLTLTAWFPRAVALYPSSDVRVLGLVAGKIKDVTVVGNKVKVVLSVKEDVPIPKDVHAMIVPQSLIGERYVQLFPAWKDGDPKITNGETIPESRTSIPVEPDEALAALKKFIDTLDPNATGKLVKNLAADLKGTGGDLNRAVGGLADLASTVASKDDEIAHIIGQFDDFTTTLETREAQLGQVMDKFAKMTSILAEERRSVEGLVRGLGQVSGDALDLVSEHGAKLDHDLQVLTRTLQMVDANLDSVKQVLDAGPILVNGLVGGFDPTYQRIDLRTQFSPAAQQALMSVLQPLGISAGDVVCVPADVKCVPNPYPNAQGGTPSPAPAALPRPTIPPLQVPQTTPNLTAPTLPAPTTTVTVPSTPPTTSSPVDGILNLLGQGTYRPALVAAQPSLAERTGKAILSLGGFARRAITSFLGVAR